MFGIKARWFQVKYVLIYNTDRIKTTVLINKNTKDKAVVNKQRKVSIQTTNEYKQQIIPMDNINIIMLWWMKHRIKTMSWEFSSYVKWFMAHYQRAIGLYWKDSSME